MNQNNFRLIKIIGQGTSGTVYLGKQDSSEKEVAIKKVRLHHGVSHSEAILRFKKEAEMVSSFSHPYIAKLKNLVEKENSIYIVMEYFPGGNLKENLATLSLKEKVEAIQKTAEALHYIHEKHIIHRDIKPANILVNHKENEIDVRLIDFGLAYLTDYKLKEKNQKVVGSFSYMSPEQSGFLRRPVDRRSDLYSLGASFYETLTGQPPFIENDLGKLIHRHLSSTPQKPSSINTKIPKMLDDIILKLLKKEPDERYQTAYGLQEDLRVFLKSPELKNFKIASKDSGGILNHQIKIIGRNKELSQLKTYYDKIAEREAQQVFISGPSGAGKSKLVQTFLEQNTETNDIFCSFKCESSRQNIPFLPLIQLIEKSLNFLNPTQLIKELKEKLGDNVEILYTLFPSLSIKNENETHVHSQTNISKQDTFNAIFSLLKLIGNQNKNILFYIDDLQWADEETLELLTFFNKKIGAAQVLILSTIRDDESTGTKLDLLKKSYPTIEIHFLKFDSIPVFIKKILNSKKELPLKLYEKVYEKTLGSPFFVLEMINLLHKEKILFFQDQNWQVNLEALKNFSFEKDVSKLIQKKIDSLTLEEKKLLSTAAVIGKLFSSKLLLKVSTERNSICYSRASS